MRVRVLAKYWCVIGFTSAVAVFIIHTENARNDHTRAMPYLIGFFVLSAAFYIVCRLSYLEFRYARGGLVCSSEYLVDLSKWSVARIGPITGIGHGLVSVSFKASSFLERLWPPALQVSLEEKCAGAFIPFNFRRLARSTRTVTVIISKESAWSIVVSVCRSASAVVNPSSANKALVRIEVWGRSSQVQLPSQAGTENQTGEKAKGTLTK
jgi:hypothetical protein